MYRKKEDLIVLYEDNHLLIIDKAVGLLSQGNFSLDLNALDLAKSYIKEKYQKKGNVFVGLVHRLDRNVGGVMVLAKTSKAASRLFTALQEKKVTKYYTAIVTESDRLKEHETLTHLCKKDKKLKKMFHAKSRDMNKKDVQTAILSYKRCQMNTQLAKINHISSSPLFAAQKKLVALEILLETGRFHQIRFQMSQIACPIVGDKKYGATTEIMNVPIALHASRILFPHPTLDRVIDISSKLPHNWFQV